MCHFQNWFVQKANDQVTARCSANFSGTRQIRAHILAAKIDSLSHREQSTLLTFPPQPQPTSYVRARLLFGDPSMELFTSQGLRSEISLTDTSVRNASWVRPRYLFVPTDLPYLRHLLYAMPPIAAPLPQLSPERGLKKKNTASIRHLAITIRASSTGYSCREDPHHQTGIPAPKRRREREDETL